MKLDWAAETVGRMHLLRVTGLELSKEAGITNSYLSAVLHDKKGDDKTRQNVTEALDRIEQRRAAGAGN